jgi:hypothetical protein
MRSNAFALKSTACRGRRLGTGSTWKEMSGSMVHGGKSAEAGTTQGTNNRAFPRLTVPHGAALPLGSTSLRGAFQDFEGRDHRRFNAAAR